MSTPLHIGLACGGTGGHIFPGLATAAELRRAGHRVTLWLSGKDIETDAVKHWDGPRITVPSEGFQHGISIRSARTMISLASAVLNCREKMKRDKPHVVLAMGSYASIGPALAARSLGVPVALHEANVTPGRALQFLSRHARLVAGCFEESRHYLRKIDLEITGFPLRPEIKQAAAGFVYQPMRSGRFHVLITGGSRGATPLNRIVSEAATLLYRDTSPPIDITHVSGPRDAEAMRAYYAERSLPVTVLPFVHDMAALYRKADLAICRAGAATCAELAAFGIPALLVPYPFAARDHQTANADAMSRSRAADMVREQDLEAEWLAEYIEGCMHTPSRLLRISRAIRTRGTPDAAERLAECVVQTARSHNMFPAHES